MSVSKIFSFLIILLVILCINVNAQPVKDYAANWKKVEGLVEKGLSKSAIEEVNVIYNMARKDNNDVQVIKALSYRLGLQRSFEEDATVKSIYDLEKEITQNKEPAKSILHSITATMYWNYFQQNRWKLYGRSNTVDFKKDDVETWTLDDFMKVIGDHYLASLKDEVLLQRTRLDPFDPIINKGNVRYLRPTLYDLLAHRALDFFQNDERNVTKPAYAFEIKDEEAFAGAENFSRHRFETKDSLSLHHKALLIYQEILRFHLRDPKPDALIDADIKRIEFVRTHGLMENKEVLYRKALQQIVTKYPSSPASEQAAFLVAQHVYSMGMDEDGEPQPPSEKNKYARRDAKKLLDAIVKSYPDSTTANAKNLIRSILHQELSLTAEKVDVPNKPFRVLVNYRNFSSLNFRLISLTPESRKELDEDNRDHDQLWKKLKNMKALKSWKQPLPATDDYMMHAIEVKVDGLPVGQYALFASTTEDFSLGNNPMAVQYFHVSNISFISNQTEYFILHRETGKPLAGAKVQVWLQRYDYNRSKNIFEKAELLTADVNGYLQIKKKKNLERNIRLDITHGSDRLFLDDYQYTYFYDERDVEKDFNAEKYEKDNERIFLFTDRSIYRPGQRVYFKGIATTLDAKTRKPKLLAGKNNFLAILFDANGQKVDSINLNANEYGSFHHSFNLPEGLLNGDFRININNSSTNFSVEEYKRPKFFADFEKIKGTYRVNDMIRITGFAKVYAGNNIDGADVKYRVKRIARFPYPWLWGRWGMPRSSEMEIVNGEMKTGTDGKFIIEFKAIPDLKVDKKFDPLFDYKVEVDVTDVNGETRSSNTIVTVGYKALNLQIILPEFLHVDSLKKLTVSTRNLAGVFESSSVNVIVYKLTPPDRLIRKRYWAEPDQFILSKSEYLAAFPHDEYKDESKTDTWPKSPAIINLNEKTTEASPINLGSNKLSQGWYVVEVTAKDKYSQDVKDVKYFQLYDPANKELPAVEYQWDATIKSTVEPGETAKFLSGSSANDIFLIQQIDKSRAGSKEETSTSIRYFSLNNEKKPFDFPVTEDDRGGFGVYQFFVKDNRVYTKSWFVNVPWTNKELDITFQSFRDKTLPGSEEKYKIKISGKKGEKLAAEMLASMYDASLDQFQMHSWAALNIWPSFNGYSNWTGNLDFTYANSTQRWWQEIYLELKNKIYDELIAGEAMYYGNTRRMGRPEPVSEAKAANMESVVITSANQAAPPPGAKDKGDVAIVYDQVEAPQKPEPPQTSTIRKNFNETAFFFPELKTDAEGSIEFSFTIPEALTEWKLMLLAHTKDLASAYATKTVITQKELMVQPNAPRFLREGDKMEFSAKIVNLGSKAISGDAQLELLNATTMQPVDGWFKNSSPKQSFNIPAGQSAAVKFHIEVPVNYANALVYRIVARSGAMSDGEENSLPVLTNRMLVTETMPLPVRGNVEKTFSFEKLSASSKSTTLTHHALTVEYTTNPAWLVVQALPFLKETKYGCADHIFTQYYANSLASFIANSSPRIKYVFEKWKTKDTGTLLSNLQKNEELKAVLLQETPWVLEAKTEEEQRKNIILLFDMHRMSAELSSSLEKLIAFQSSNGGFVWFKGGPDNRYMTQYIITGLGHLQKINALLPAHKTKLQQMMQKGVTYLDRKIKEDYDELIRHKADLKKDHIGYIAIQYLYMRSFFKDIPIAQASKTANDFYKSQAAKFWLSKGKYMQGMIALAQHRTGNTKVATDIINSLKENSIVKEEMGMYWNEWNNRGYFWYQAPIESQALMIEAFHEITGDLDLVDDLKTWLLKNKQTNSWETTRATAEACYAMLLQGTDWLIKERNVEITLGDKTIRSKDEKQEEGTGYFKKRLDGSEVKPAMGNITVKVSAANETARNESAGTSWGAVYWQYFEDLDKITFAETPLKLSKKIFRERNSDRGPVITPVNDGDKLKVGDKIKVRIELRVDREMEYVHMKDMRAAAMEPVNVLSNYKWQGGLGYYESTKDASTNFFFDWLRRGTYVFEYTLFVTHSGNFSNGITTIQSMYAPEFTAHSEGIRIIVE